MLPSPAEVETARRALKAIEDNRKPSQADAVTLRLWAGQHTRVSLDTYRQRDHQTRKQTRPDANLISVPEPRGRKDLAATDPVHITARRFAATDRRVVLRIPNDCIRILCFVLRWFRRGAYCLDMAMRTASSGETR